MGILSTLKKGMDFFTVGPTVEVQNRYDAASRGKRLRGWRTDQNSINTDSRLSRKLIVQRHRDLVNNHWAAARAVSVIQRNTVGTGITPTVRDNPEYNEFIRGLIRTTKLDPAGRKTLAAIQELIIRSIVTSGDVIIIRRRRTQAQMRRYGLDLPLQIEILESDHLDYLVDGPLPNGNFAVQGVEYDDQNVPVAYHLYVEHPGDVYRFNSIKSVRVPASECIVPFEELRPGQARGIPWGVSAIIKMKGLSEYEDAQLQKQKLSNAFAGFIYHDDNTPLDKLYDNDGIPVSIQPGTMEYLRPGERVEFSNPPQVQGFREFSEVNERHIASAYNITLQALNQDYSSVNFSSGRMGWIEMHRHVESWQYDIMIAQVCTRLEEWIREASAAVGMNTDGPRWKWTPPRREMIDPVKETQAAVLAITSGLNSASDEITRRGRDPKDVIAEIQQWNEMIDEAGIILDSDPRVGIETEEQDGEDSD